MLAILSGVITVILDTKVESSVRVLPMFCKQVVLGPRGAISPRYPNRTSNKTLFNNIYIYIYIFEDISRGIRHTFMRMPSSKAPRYEAKEPEKP